MLVLFLFILFFYFISKQNIAYAAWYDGLLTNIKGQTSNIATIFANFDGIFRISIGLLKFVAIIVGLTFFVQGGLKLVRASDGKEMASSSLYTLIASVFFISFVPAIDMFSNTMGFNGTTDGLARACEFTFKACVDNNSSLSGYIKAGLTGVISFVRLVGYIAIFRGFYGIYELGGKGGGGQNGFWKAVMFMVGGVICVNILPFGLLIAREAAPNSGLVDFLENSDFSLVIK